MDLFLPLMLAMAAAFLFLSFRNQKKAKAKMEELQSSAVPGTRIQLSCGLYGTITSDNGGDTVDVEIAPGVVTEWNRLAVREVYTDETLVSTGDDIKIDDIKADDASQPKTDDDAK